MIFMTQGRREQIRLW